MIDYADYHPHFRKIARFVVLIRAKNRCEHCGVANNAVGYWQHTGKGQRPRWVPLHGSADADNLGAGYGSYGEARAYAGEYNQWMADEESPRLRVVKLACAHLDHDIQRNELDNLASLCQGCHRHHDSRDNAERRMYGPTGQHRYQIRLFTDSRYAPDPDVPKPQRTPRKKRRYVRQTYP